MKAMETLQSIDATGPLERAMVGLLVRAYGGRP